MQSPHLQRSLHISGGEGLQLRVQRLLQGHAQPALELRHCRVLQHLVVVSGGERVGHLKVEVGGLYRSVDLGGICHSLGELAAGQQGGRQGGW